jgi:L-seryl-tRNA(Ser) seleniumtransferase
VIQKSHRYVFDQAVRNTGVKLVEVEGTAGMEKAINKNTVMALFFNAARDHSITHEEFVAIGKKHNIPTFIDAAADVPPVENLFKYQKMGFDLVTFSGGKMIRGPQSTGLLFGRKDLIEAAKLNHSPYECPIGRPMKCAIGADNVLKNPSAPWTPCDHSQKTTYAGTSPLITRP